MVEKLIFISCGQQTSEEKELGMEVKELIDSISGYRSYFAEYVQSLDGLAQNIFESLRICSGFITFLHDRGKALMPNGEEWGHRSSVWVNQELAILAYRKYFEGIDIPILVFKDHDVQIEGAMTSLIVNPKPLHTKSEVLIEVRSWLQSTRFPINNIKNDDRFKSKWEKLDEFSIKVIICLLDEGGKVVKENAIRECLIERFGFSNNDASHAIRKAKLKFIDTDLVKCIRNVDTGHEISLNQTWEWHIIRKINEGQN